MPDPTSRYEERLRASEASAASLRRVRTAVEWVRYAASGLAALVLAVAVGTDASPLWLLVPLSVFAVASVVHRLLSARLERVSRAAAFHRDGLARLRGEWTETRFTGDEDAPVDHPYARDLDVVGERSVFARVCRARTSAGASTLARWLLQPATAAEVAARQEAVAELRDRLELREAFELAGPPGPVRADAGRLAAWGRAPAALPWRWLGLPLVAAAAAVVVAVAGAAASAWGIALPLGAVAIAGALHLVLRRRVGAVLALVLDPAARLSTLAELMRVVEREELHSPLLRGLRARLLDGGPASVAVRRLARRVGRLLAMRSELVGAVGYLLLWPAREAVAVEAFRARYGAQIEGWIEALGEFEALSSLASHAFESPGDTFPEVLDGAAPLFTADGLGHPLLPAKRCVPNDVRLSASGPALILLSGSNMSGKSTLIRAVGANAVLALAGGTVRARRLRLSRLAVGASIRAHDSVIDGESRFQSELRRLRAIVALTDGALPVLFLVDELLHGTNSHDRLRGAEGVLRGLVQRGAIGICSTHDLVLTRIADGLGPRATNLHFTDRLRDGKLTFDYALRPGVVEHSNALELMRAVGLEV